MERGTAASPAWWKVLTVALGIVVVSAGCGSSGTSSSSSTPTAAASSSSASATATPNTAAVCQDAAALRASLGKLTSVKVAAGTADEIKTDLKAVQANLTKLADDAGTQFQTQISALKSALGTLQTAATNLASNPSASAVTSVATALAGVTAVAHQLLTAVSKGCPSASPSP